MTAPPQHSSSPAPAPLAAAPAATATYARLPRPPRVPWYVIYYMLAIFDFLTVSTLLYLNHRSVGVFVRSIEINQRWAQVMAAFAELGAFAAAVNAPGNDVFDSGDVTLEYERMERAMQAMQERLSRLRGELLSRGPEPETAQLLEGMDEVDRVTTRMTEQSRSIFVHFAAGRRALAGRRWPAWTGATTGCWRRCAPSRDRSPASRRRPSHARRRRSSRSSGPSGRAPG